MLTDVFTDEELLELDLAELEAVSAKGKEAPDNWRDRLRAIFPNYVQHEFSGPHADLWRWAEQIGPDSSPRPFVAIWPRGRGKSTHAEMIAADLGARGVRRYCLYVCETQDQADKHVSSIQTMLESGEMAEYFPGVGEPRVGKHGSRTWRRSLLQASNGFSVEAIGLDKAIRGQKIDWVRPDLIIFDDVDGKHDTENATSKKQETITTSILPAGADNVAVLFVQNLIHRDSIAHRLSKSANDQGAADFMADRIISGPYPAVEGLEYEFIRTGEGQFKWHIAAGDSLWNGYDIDQCESEINLFGPSSFELESQHDVDADNPNALLTTAIIDAARVDSHPDLIRVAVGVDPSGGAGQCGIIASGTAKIGREMHGFTIADYSTPKGTSSNDWATAVLRCYHAVGADVVLVETNFGGDMVENTIRNAILYDAEGQVILKGRHLTIIAVNASRGKEVRAQPVATLFERGIWHHVGRFVELEKQWTRWVPGTKPSPDRLDSEVWTGTHLLVGGAPQSIPAQPEQPSRWKVGRNGKTIDGSRFKGRF